MTAFDDFASNFVQAELRKQDDDKMRERLHRSMGASMATVQGRFDALKKSGDLEDLASVAFYAGKLAQVASIMRREYGDADAEKAVSVAWQFVIDGVKLMEG